MKNFKLFASAPDKESIIKLIAKFWYAKNESIQLIENNGQYDVINNNKLMNDFRVILKGKRFRFEAVV